MFQAARLHILLDIPGLQTMCSIQKRMARRFVGSPSVYVTKTTCSVVEKSCVLTLPRPNINYPSSSPQLSTVISSGQFYDITQRMMSSSKRNDISGVHAARCKLIHSSQQLPLNDSNGHQNRRWNSSTHSNSDCKDANKKAIWTGEFLLKPSVKNGMFHAIINRPKKLNAINTDIVVTWSNYLQELQSDARCDAILLTGEGTKAFCAGGDVQSVLKLDKENMKHFFASEYRMNVLIKKFTKPYISIWQGIVMGGGVGISLYGSIRVATEKTMFTMPEGSIGFLQDVGASYFLPRLADGVGLYTALTGLRLNGGQCLRLGLATHFVPTWKIDELVRSMLSESFAGDAETKIRRVIDTYTENADSHSGCTEIPNEVLEMTRRHFTNVETLTELVDALTADGSDVCLKTVQEIKERCPLTSALFIRLYVKGATQSLSDCLRAEFAVATSDPVLKNFREGVRAALQDKTHDPKWSPSTVAEIDEAAIDDILKSAKYSELDSLVQMP